VTCLGVDEKGNFLIYDPPFPMVETELSMVLANWDGIALEVHQPNAPQFRPLMGIAIVMGCFVVVAMAFRLLRLYVSQRVPLVTQVAIVSTGLVAVGSLFHFTSRVGIFNHSTAIAAVQDRYFGSDFDDVGLAELEASRQRGALLIDARKGASFRSGSIPGAISIPIDSSLPYRDKVLSKIDREKEVVVFCQSHRCDYSDKVARFLKFNGFKNIRIYRNGIMEWEERNASS
jgi:rhodanese-related sulfurtransferase